jgi:oligopeptide transport system ATP-binding protein
MESTIFRIDTLSLSFKNGRDEINVLRNINLNINHGEIISLVGESGSGKSVFLRTLIGLNARNGQYKSGSIMFEDQDLTKIKDKEWEKFRGKKIAMIFQDPMNSLNPVKKVKSQIIEVVKLHQKIKNKKELNKLALEYLNIVKIKDADKVMNMYPHQLSGGMKQRIVIAIILACKPDVILADEPTTAIDTTVQSEILRLLLELQTKYKLTIVFVTHDIGVVSQISDRVAVMYAGKIVEVGMRNEVINNPQHPYTRALLSSLPQMGNKKGKLEAIEGTPPNLSEEIKGDAFAPRNKFALEIDYEEEPPMFEVSPSHKAATWLLHPDAKAVKQKFDAYYLELGVINE